VSLDLRTKLNRARTAARCAEECVGNSDFESARCHIGFGEFVRAATIDHRGWIQRFDCPACSILVIKLETIDRTCHRYVGDCVYLESGEAA
jgi:hypothetical protein